MKKMKIVNCFIFPLAIFGLVNVFMFCLGYRLIIDEDAVPDWQAISSIATVLAVLVALFITKWQDILSNKKNIELKWLNVERKNDLRYYHSDFTNNRRIDEVCIKFINTGNRKVILNSFYIEFPNKEKNIILPEAINSIDTTNDVHFPCVLEPEMATQLHIPSEDIFNHFIY